MFKVGDEVLVKATVVGNKRPYGAQIQIVGANGLLGGIWFPEEELIPVGKTYEQGLADSWNLLKKVYDMKCETIEQIFDVEGGFWNVIRDFTYEEALAKIEAYEKEIKVGDVVEDNEGTKALVIDEATENTCFVFTENGCVEDWYKMDLKKTGNEISIGDLLRQIGE